MNNYKLMGLSLILTGLMNSAHASNIQPVVVAGLYFGGDNLVETNRDDLEAGGLFHFGGGFSIQSPDSDVSYQLTLGYKFDSVDFDIPKGDSSISSLPLEFSAYHKLSGPHRIGAGVAYHINPEYELCFSGSGCNTAKFDNALGFSIEYGYDISNQMFWGVKYTSIDYDSDRLRTIDASNLGFLVGFKIY